MGLLQYKSNEMFSSTELIRKSKNIFDKLNKNEIEKAIILRDGKPGIILLDFNYYEKIIAEYLSLKGEKNDLSVHKNKIEKHITEDNFKKVKEKIELESISNNFERLDFSFDTDLVKDKDEPLKEFWD
jgi:hypothetical protein